ncbi:MAG TPA: HNH endonuclease [Abditibacteriaceae bacterium]|jgi:putative restriction endonuclease
MTSVDTEHWLKVVANLRVDRKGGIAPHQPLLLLVVAELAEEGKLSSSRLELTGELSFRFLSYWTVVAPRRTQKPEIYLPFYHLKNIGGWHPLDENHQPTLERKRAVIVDLDESLFSCFQDAEFREHLRRVLIAKYFVDAGERAALYYLVGLPIPPDDIVEADARLYEAARERGREARFRLTVVPAYDYTCALTNYRLVTVGAGSIVDAAHIHQFADSRNNHPQNGIALSKNAHWMFDQGLWSLDDDYRVLVATSRFHESGNEALSLNAMQGKQILLPANRNYWPDKAHLAWHRREKLNTT